MSQPLPRQNRKTNALVKSVAASRNDVDWIPIDVSDDIVTGLAETSFKIQARTALPDPVIQRIRAQATGPLCTQPSRKDIKGAESSQSGVDEIVDEVVKIRQCASLDSGMQENLLSKCAEVLLRSLASVQ